MTLSNIPRYIAAFFSLVYDVVFMPINEQGAVSCINTLPCSFKLSFYFMSFLNFFKLVMLQDLVFFKSHYLSILILCGIDKRFNWNMSSIQLVLLISYMSLRALSSYTVLITIQRLQPVV